MLASLPVARTRHEAHSVGSTMKAKRSKTPLLIHSLPEGPTTSTIVDYFESREFVLFEATAPDDVRRHCSREQPDGVILCDRLAPESAWLTVAKLRAQNPDLRVVVLCETLTPHAESLGKFVGAKAVLPMSATPAVIAQKLLGTL